MTAIRLVKVVDDAELAQNGGIYVLQGNVAWRVEGFESDPGLGIAGGAILPVYIVPDSLLNNGTFGVVGNAPLLMGNYTLLGGGDRPIAGNAALPVYIELGSLGEEEETEPVVYLLHENFSVADAAPIATPKDCTPGPGTLNYVDTVTGADASIADGFYERPRPTGGQGYANYGAYSSDSFQSTPGLFFYTRVKSSTIDQVVPISAAASAALGDTGSGFFNWAAGTVLDLKEIGNTDVRLTGLSFTANTIYHFGLRRRSSGWDYYVKGGSQYPDWTLLWVNVLSNTNPLYVQTSNFNAQLSQDTILVGRIQQSPFNLDYGIATYFNATPQGGDIVIGEDDGLTYLTWRPEAGETLIIRFRRTDDDNCYRLECSQSGGTIKLFRREAAVDTELDAGKTQTFAAGTAYRIAIQAIAGAIQTRVNNTIKHNVTGESFNLTATGVKVSGFATASYLEIYPRNNPTAWAFLETLETL